MYDIRFTKEALQDIKNLSPRLKSKLKKILENRIAEEPHSGKKLLGQLEGFYSVRLTFQDRIVYTIDKETRTVYVHRTRSHYGD
jgi:mRNA-degrading endonuclease RelE of RelBE toxin-antitoxin system